VRENFGKCPPVLCCCRAHSRSQDFVWGCTFLDQKSDDSFSHHLLFHGHVRYILPPPTFLSHLRGCTSPDSTHFCLISIKIAFFVALGVHLHPLHHLATPVVGPRLWNSLPKSLRQMSSYGQFRRYLKNHLFGF